MAAFQLAGARAAGARSLPVLVDGAGEGEGHGRAAHAGASRRHNRHPRPAHPVGDAEDLDEPAHAGLCEPDDRGRGRLRGLRRGCGAARGGGACGPAGGGLPPCAAVVHKADAGAAGVAPGAAAPGEGEGGAVRDAARDWGRVDVTVRGWSWSRSGPRWLE